jgi:hypothetical protein
MKRLFARGVGAIVIAFESNVPGFNPPPFRRSASSRSGLTGCFELPEHVGLAGPRVPPMKKLPLAGGARATFSSGSPPRVLCAVGWRSARSLPPFRR